jgi:hypothetical protein
VAAGAVVAEAPEEEEEEEEEGAGRANAELNPCLDIALMTACRDRAARICAYPLSVDHAYAMAMEIESKYGLRSLTYRQNKENKNLFFLFACV